MKKKKTTLNTIIKIAVLIAILLGIIFVVYYFAIYVPQRNKDETERQIEIQRQAERDKADKEFEAKEELNVCNGKAEVYRANYLIAHCEKTAEQEIGADGKTQNLYRCPLTPEYDHMKEEYNKTKTDCNNTYQQNK